MSSGPEPYEWTPRDKWLYALSMVPFVVVFVGTTYLLWTHAPHLAATFVGLYLLTNVFQAGCCIGCPYRSRYCPALCGVYLGNMLSGVLYPRKEFEEGFFRRNAAAGETMVVVLILFPLYWVFRTSWYLVPVYLVLVAAHFALFMPTQCGKCSFNDTCPGGRAWMRMRGHRCVSTRRN